MTMADVIVGSYSQQRPGRQVAGEGVSLLSFNSDTGALATRDVLGGLPNPSYVLTHGNLIYTVIETPAESAGLATLQVRDGRLALLGQVPVAGDGPCHIDRHAGGFLAVSCYGSGHVSIHPVDAAGVAQAAGSVVAHAGSGPNAARQAGPHAHAAAFAPDGGTLLVADLGTDEVWCHRFDAAAGQLHADAVRWRAPPGSGPRLLLFSPAHDHVLLLTELGCGVLCLRWQDGALTLHDSTSTLAPGWAGPNTAAGLRWHPSGRWFAASNRGADSVALFSFEAGAIRQVSAIGAGGPKPRDFEFSPCGRWLLAASQDGDCIAVLAVDSDRLTDTGIRHRVGTPSCVRFLSNAKATAP